MKSLIAILFCFILLSNAATVTWKTTVPSGDWNVGTNWVGDAVPGSADTAQFTIGADVSVGGTGNTQINILQTSSGFSLTVLNGATFTAANISQSGTNNFNTEPTGHIVVNAYFIFSGQQTNFDNQGITELNPFFQGSLPSGRLYNNPLGNDVVFRGTLKTYLNADVIIPRGFSFPNNVQYVFETSGSTNIMYLDYTPTINSNGWRFINDVSQPATIAFNFGAVLNGVFSVSNTNNNFPGMFFAGDFTVNGNLNFQAIPSFQSSQTVTVNGGSLTFTNQAVLLNVPEIQGTSTINFINNRAFAVPVTLTLANNPLVNSNLVFTGNWIFSSSTIRFNVPYTFNFNVTLNNCDLIFLKTATISSGALFLNNGGSSVKFTDSYNSGVAFTWSNFAPTMDCTMPTKTFSFTGNSAISFPNGVTFNGCTVSSQAQISVDGSLTTSGGNTSLPAPPTVSYVTGFTFSANGAPTNGRYGITINGAFSVPGAFDYTVSNVELTVTGSMTLSSNARLFSNSNGLFTFNQGFSWNQNNIIQAEIALPSGDISLTGTNRIDFNSGSNLLLRNTNLVGTGDVWYNVNTIRLTKGISTITNPNFKFKGGISTGYLWDQFEPNTGAQLVITGGTGNIRILEGSVIAGTSTNVVFDNNINVNSTGSTSFTATQTGSAITFRQTGLNPATITTPGVVTLNGNLYINNTNFHFTGLGNYIWATSSNVFLQGQVNNPFTTGDSFVTTPGTINLYLVADSTLGESVTINSNLNTFDFDQNPNTASRTLTLASGVTEARTISGAYDLGTNLIFGGNIVISSGATVDSVGSIQINGNSVHLTSSAVWRNKVILTSATTVTAASALTWTLREQDIIHGLNLPGSLTITEPATVAFQDLYSLSFSSSASAITGTGSASFTNMFISNSDSATKTISTQSASFSNVTFIGTGAYAISPASNLVTIANFIRSFVTCTFSSSSVVANSAFITPNVVFSASTITLTGSGSGLTVMEGSYTINQQWINNAPITFSGTVTLGNTLTFDGTGALTFNTTLILTRTLTLSQDVTFGFNKDYLVTVSNNNFRLDLTGNTITVSGNVVSNGGTILSTSPSSVNPQFISGGGVIDSSWTWANTVRFGSLNVTGQRTLNFNLILTNSLTTYFTDGVVFNGGTFTIFVSGDNPTLAIETSVQTNVATNLIANINLQLSSTSTTGSVTFSGANTLVINGTVECMTSLVFSSNVVFGWTSPTGSNQINIRPGTNTWSGSALSLYRNTIAVFSGANVQINNALTFQMETTTVTTGASRSITFNGDLTVAGKTLSTSGSNVFVSAITINSLQNCTISGLNLLASLTFSSTTSPWVEPVFSVADPFVQTLVLNGPVRMDNPTFSANSRVTGTGRLALTNGVTIKNADFRFEAPVQLYITNAGGFFTFTLDGTQTYLTFPTNPSLFNPLGFNLVNNLNIQLTSGSASNVLLFQLSGPITFGDINVNSGILRFSSNSLTAQIITVSGGASLWIDGTTVSAQQLIFSQSNLGTNPSNFFYSLSSTTPAPITVQKAIYKGIININVVNFNWDGNALNIITATSANGATGNFIAAYGTPGYSYSSSRNGNSLQIARVANPSVSPFPTQSNGPSPGVSSSSIISINFILLAITLILYILN